MALRLQPVDVLFFVGEPAFKEEVGSDIRTQTSFSHRAKDPA